MEEFNPDFIERYQEMYAADPKSRVFAPLAEAYRKIGLLNEALEVAERGVQIHPLFAGGRVALGRIYEAMNHIEKAELEYKRAVQLSPENVLAHQLLANLSLKLKKPKEALRSFKMILFMNPSNEKARHAIQKLESLTADEYDAEIFNMKPLNEAVKDWDLLHVESQTIQNIQSGKIHDRTIKNIERALSLADAHIARNDIERAVDALTECEHLYGPHPDVTRRLKHIHERQLDSVAFSKTSAEVAKPLSRHDSQLDEQIQFLQDVLQKLKNVNTTNSV